MTPITLQFPTNTHLLGIPIVVSRAAIAFRPVSTNDVLAYTEPEGADREHATLTVTRPTALQFNFKILEHNDGALIQIIYAGAISGPIILEGTIVGQQTLHEVQVRHVALYPQSSPITLIGIIILTCVAGTYMFFDVGKELQRRGLGRERYAIVGAGVFVIVGVAAGAVYMLVTLFKVSTTVTPFGF